MAKTIKFNLICDNKPIRTIEDLQNNFSIEDMLAYYNNQLLHRWLDVRDYKDELEKVRAITADKPVEIVKELIKIFNVASDDKKIEESVYILEYLEERKKLCSIYEKENYKTKLIIDDYKNGYVKLVDDILKNPNDDAIIKANISEIMLNYAWIFQFDYRNLFYSLKGKSALAIMCLLMNEHSRKYFLPIETKKEDETVTHDTQFDKDEVFNTISKAVNSIYPRFAPITETKKEDEAVTHDTQFGKDKDVMYRDICSMIKTSDLGEHLMTFSGLTDGYWKDLEPKGKKCMIIKMGNGDFVRSAGLSGGDLSSTDIENKFVIVDGIDYKSNNSSHELMYMEV